MVHPNKGDNVQCLKRKVHIMAISKKIMFKNIELSQTAHLMHKWKQESARQVGNFKLYLVRKTHYQPMRPGEDFWKRGIFFLNIFWHHIVVKSV